MTSPSVGTRQGFNLDKAHGTIKYPTYRENVKLVANTAVSVPVPTWAAYAIFTGFGAGDFYVSYDGSDAVVPSATTTDGSGNEANPTQRFLGVGNVAALSLISAVNNLGCILFMHE